jgi:hypothetical protein
MSTAPQQNHLDSLQKVHEEYAKLEAKMLDQARQAVDEAARLWRAALGYSEQMSAECRRVAFEAAKRSQELFPTARI